MAKTKLTFDKTHTDPNTGWKGSEIRYNKERIGQIVKDTGSHWQINLYADGEFLQELNRDHDFWYYMFDEFDGETLREAKDEVKSTLEPVIEQLLDCDSCDI